MFSKGPFLLLFLSMERALSLAEEPEVVADIWYNLGHIGINLGECNCARIVTYVVAVLIMILRFEIVV